MPTDQYSVTASAVNRVVGARSDGQLKDGFILDVRSVIDGNLQDADVGFPLNIVVHASSTITPTYTWTRNGTTLEPANAGDDVDLGTGDLTAAKGTFTGDVAINDTGIGTKIYAEAASGNLFAQRFEALAGINDRVFTSQNFQVTEGGTVLLGGTLPASPNIILQSNGGAVFANNAFQINDKGVLRIDTDTETSIDIQGGNQPNAMDALRVLAPNATVLVGIKYDGSATFAGRIDGTATASGIDMFRLTKNGTVQARITSNGSIFALDTTLQQQTSERRLKEDITPIDADVAWETVKSVPYYNYKFIGDDTYRYGPMADEVPDEMRIATDRSDDVGVIHTYDNGMLQARLYTALQTALTRIEALEAKVQQLEGGTK